MKKISGILLLLLVFAVKSYSQTLKLLDENNHIINDSTIEASVNNDSLYQIHINVVNDGQTDLNVRTAFFIISVLDEISYAYCWGTCYDSPRSGHTAQATMIAAGDTLRDYSSVYYNVLDKTGTSEFKLVYADVSDLEIASEVKIKFVTIHTSINEEKDYLKLSDPFPNPADNYVTFNFNEYALQDCKIELWSILGKLLYNYKAGTNAQEVTIPLFDVTEGIVFYKIFDGNKLIKTGKIVVNH